MPRNWITRGKKPERQLEAALAGFVVGGVRAWIEGRDPVVGGTAHAVASAAAMRHHRLAARARAHPQYIDIADKVTEAGEHLLRHRREAATRRSTEAWNAVVARWNAYVEWHGRDPGRLGINEVEWSRLSADARQQLVAVAREHAVTLVLWKS